MPTIQSINPYSGELNWEFELINEPEIENKIQCAHEAYKVWSKTSFHERKKYGSALADELEKDIEECAQLQTQEMWMLYQDSLAGLKWTVALLRWNVEVCESVLGSKPFSKDGLEGIEMYDSIGVLFWVAPWNVPFNQLLRAALPNILAGNVQLYKHASNVPMCAAKIQELFDKAWFPKGVYTNMFVSSRYSEKIISDKRVVGVNLTGSEYAGSSVGSLAGKYLKPSVLELGGNDAFIVAETTDLDFVVSEAVNGRMRLGWQGCNNSKRFVVLEKDYDEFCTKFAEKMSSLKIGDPMDSDSQVPPLSSQKALDEIDGQVKSAIETGATLLTWWKQVDMPWSFYEPTVLANVTKETATYDQEIFGPVASIIKSKSIEDSIRIANDSDFGLSAVVYGDNIQQCRDIAVQLDGGMVFINGIASSKAQLPFGWVRKSGYGKENGAEGLRAFTNKKVVIY